jgi:hypothetical protein
VAVKGGEKSMGPPQPNIVKSTGEGRSPDESRNVPRRSAARTSTSTKVCVAQSGNRRPPAAAPSCRTVAMIWLNGARNPFLLQIMRRVAHGASGPTSSRTASSRTVPTMRLKRLAGRGVISLEAEHCLCQSRRPRPHLGPGLPRTLHHE